MGLVYGDPPTVKSALLAMNCELPAVLDETDLLKELKSQSDYPGSVTLPWLKSELTQFFTAKGSNDLATNLRKFRQQHLLNNFWNEFW